MEHHKRQVLSLYSRHHFCHMVHDARHVCSFMTVIGLHTPCEVVSWAVLLTTARFFNEVGGLKDESGNFAWLADGLQTDDIERTGS